MTEAEIELLALKKRVAMSPHREAALTVILPRLIGAIKHDPEALAGDNLYRVTREGLTVQLWLKRQHLELLVYKQTSWELLYCKLFSGGNGDRFGQRVKVVSWDRSASTRSWQSQIFDIFPKDSNWLLDIPQQPEFPAIVKAAMADINSRAGSAIYQL